MKDRMARREPARPSFEILKKMLLWILLIPPLLLVVVMIYLYANQGRMIFAPSAQMLVTPDEIGMVYRDVDIEVSPEVTLHSWYFEGMSGGKTVLFCHGNAGNISSRLETVQFLMEQGAGVLLFDYRGYGKSTGEPTEAGLYEDAESCYRTLVDKMGVAPGDIIIFGRSLGGAVAVELARRVEAGGLIIESSFTSVTDMASTIYPYLPVSMLVRYPFASIKKVGQLSLPVLVTHSLDDDMIPFAMGRELYDSLNCPKLFCPLSGSHNELLYLHDSGYVASIKKILEGRVGD